MKKYIDLVKQTFKEWSEDKAAKHAAALAYYTVFSLPPLLVIVIALAGLFGGADAAQSAVTGQVADLVGDEGGEFVAEMITAASNRPAAGIVASIVGIVTLIFGALGAFGELQDALNTIWEVKPKPVSGFGGTLKRLIMGRLLSFAMILVIGFLLLASLVVSAGLASFTEMMGNILPFPAFIITILNFVVSMGVITLLFAAMFKFLPDAKIAWKDVLLGALVTALLFTIGKFALGYYLGRSNVTSNFGAAGSLAILLLWIYYSAQIFFLGAEFTQVYANTYGSKVRPDEDAIKMTEDDRIQAGIPHKETVEQKARGEGAAVPGTLGATAALPGAAPAIAQAQQTAAARPAVGTYAAYQDWRTQPRSPHLLSPPERRKNRRAGQIVGVALLSGVLALVTSFAQIAKDIRDPRR